MLRLLLAIGLVLVSAQWGQSQCNCGMVCSSGCMCGCNDPENSPQSNPPGGFGDSQNVAFLSQVPISAMGATGSGILGNDCWGWTDPKTNREYAIFGLTNSTCFIDITNPQTPVVLGILPGAGGNDTWRDIKVYNGFAYIVADGSANASHGVQVFDLKRLRKITAWTSFTENARYTGLGRAHNIAINEETGFAYVVGSPSQSSSGGLIMLDLKQGVMPVAAGVFASDGYTHDTQVVTYRGPDTVSATTPSYSYAGREIAFCCNEDTLTIVDVTHNGSPPRMVSRTPYAGSRYSHQGWLSEDHRYFFLDDELDELQLGPFPTRTRIWDVRNLDQPVYVGHHSGTATTIDHNQYVKGNYTFQANYTSGLRILELTNPLKPRLNEVGFFDTYGADNSMTFNGAWSCYPYFPSGSIIVSDRQNGLFVLRFDPPPP